MRNQLIICLRWLCIIGLFFMINTWIVQPEWAHSIKAWLPETNDMDISKGTLVIGVQIILGSITLLISYFLLISWEESYAILSDPEVRSDQLTLAMFYWSIPTMLLLLLSSTTISIDVYMKVGAIVCLVLWIISYISNRFRAASLEDAAILIECELDHLIHYKSSISYDLGKLDHLESLTEDAMLENTEARNMVKFRQKELLSLQLQRIKLDRLRDKIKDERQSTVLLEKKMLHEVVTYFKSTTDVYMKRGGARNQRWVYANKKRYMVDFSGEGNLVGVRSELHHYFFLKKDTW